MIIYKNKFLVLQKKAIIDAAYAAVTQLIAVVTPGLAKTTALNVLRGWLDMPETESFDYRDLLVNEWYDMQEPLLCD